MARPTKQSAALSLLLAKEQRLEMERFRASIRICPDRQELTNGPQYLCATCLGTSCRRRAAMGLADDGRALPAKARPCCGAQTRAGTECTMKIVPGKFRCRLHGGLSTGPCSIEGRVRIAEAQHTRWVNWRASKTSRFSKG